MFLGELKKVAENSPKKLTLSNIYSLGRIAIF